MQGSGLTAKLWSIADIVRLVEAAEPKPGKGAPHEKRGAA
jgi:hypothetical protein